MPDTVRDRTPPRGWREHGPNVWLPWRKQKRLARKGILIGVDYGRGPSVTVKARREVDGTITILSMEQGDG